MENRYFLPRDLFEDLIETDKGLMSYAVGWTIKIVLNNKDQYEYKQLESGPLILNRFDGESVTHYALCLEKSYEKTMEKLMSILNNDKFLPVRHGQLLKVNDVKRVYVTGNYRDLK